MNKITDIYILLTYSNTMDKKSIFYTKEIVNVILLLDSMHLVFQSFLVLKIAYYNNIFTTKIFRGITE
jgi:hypothetical protein